MTIQEIIKEVRSGVCKIEFYQGDRIVNSGSGFVYRNKLVTNSHVFHPYGYNFQDDTKLKIIFGDGKTLNMQIRDLALKCGSDESNADFAVYELGYLSEADNGRFNLEMNTLDLVEEGDEVIILGFPFETSYLTTHQGRISALFTDGNIKKIQIDASINQGNSGGPLVHLATGKVIGIVTRKQSGLSKDFDDLLQSFSNNINILQQAQTNGSISMMGINPIEFFQVSQSQMQSISKNIARSANTGIGYAFSCETLLSEEF